MNCKNELRNINTDLWLQNSWDSKFTNRTIKLPDSSKTQTHKLTRYEIDHLDGPKTIPLNFPFTTFLRNVLRNFSAQKRLPTWAKPLRTPNSTYKMSLPENQDDVGRGGGGRWISPRSILQKPDDPNMHIRQRWKIKENHEKTSHTQKSQWNVRSSNSARCQRHHWANQ